MEIFISIDGVLRNTIQKFDYHYNEAYLADDVILEENNTFEYGVNEPIQNDNLMNHYKFQSQDEFDFFFYMEYPIEIFGHAGLSYSTTFTDLHKIIYENQEHNFTLVGLDELGKSKPATLFFLAKFGCLVEQVRFYSESTINSLWDSVDILLTANSNLTFDVGVYTIVNKRCC